MIDVQTVVDLLSRGVDGFRYYVHSDRWPTPTWPAIALFTGGFILALWGARLLRTIYVLGFMVGGVLIAVKVAGSIAPATQGSTLFAVILGAGFSGLVGHLFYRWWVGLTAGLCALFLVGMFSESHIRTELQGFDDVRLGVSTDVYDLAKAKAAGVGLQLAAGQTPGLVQNYLGEFGSYLWNQRRDSAVKGMLLAGLAWFFGLGMGVIFPRLTTIVCTSVLGVMALAISAGVLLACHWPTAWGAVTGQGKLLVGVLGVLFLVALWMQSRRVVRAPAPPAAPAAAPTS